MDGNEDIEVETLGYSVKYDAMYDLKTFEWAEESCGCDVCLTRPPKFPYMEVVVNNDKQKLKGKKYGKATN